MPAVDIRLELPDHIRDGIASGKFLRDGSVIVQAENHQVVCWLDEVVSYGVEGFPDVVQLLQVGGSFLLDKASERRLARIEEKLNEISIDVKELINLQHDAIFAEARASMSDLQRRLRTGEEITPDLLRALETAWVKMDRLLVRTATEGVERALEEKQTFLSLITVIGAIMKEEKATARKGQVGRLMASLAEVYFSLSLCFGVALYSVDRARVEHWAKDSRVTLMKTVDGLLEVSGNNYYTLYGGGWDGTIDSEARSAKDIVGWTAQIATDDFRTWVPCKASDLPHIQRGLLTCAEFLDLVDTGGLVREVERIPARLADQGI